MRIVVKRQLLSDQNQNWIGIHFYSDKMQIAFEMRNKEL